jgi:SAM-dependent methyltransferase
MKTMPRRALPPSIEALLWQALAVGLVFGGLRVLEMRVAGGIVAAAIGALALGFTMLRRLDRWWWPIQALFAPAIWLMLRVEVSPAVYLGAFALLALLYWSTFRTQVPLFLSNRRIWQVVESLLPPARPDQPLRFVDLGSGLGGLLAFLGRRRPDGGYAGFEVAPLPALLSRLRFTIFGPANVRVVWGNFWRVDLADYDFVFAFLSPVPMPELWAKAKREMRAGSVFVSCSFAVPGVDADMVLEAGDRRGTRLHVWRMPGPTTSRVAPDRAA